MTAAAALPLAERIGSFAAGLAVDTVPPAILERARDRILDALSTAVAGRRADPFRAVDALLGEEPPGPASVLATGATAAAAPAAFANAVACHALLYEDLVPATADHPGCVIVPAALAAAESDGTATVGDLVLGVLAGYEVQLLLGAIVGAAVIDRGFRTTSVFGTVAAAVAAARVLRLDSGRIAAAAAIGANFAMGFTQGWSEGGHEPYLQAGAAAQHALLAARLARADARHAKAAFEGRNGFFRAFAGELPSAAAMPGAPWRITEVICKPYPCSGGKIGAIDSALELRAAGRLERGRIAAVIVHLPELYYRYPGADRQAPFGSMSEAQASGRFCVAAALLGHDMQAISTFLDRFADPEIAALSARITLPPQPGTLLARVEVSFEDGSAASAEADRRDRLVPSLSAMRAKLVRLTSDAWPPGRADRVADLVCGPGNVPVSVLSQQLRAAA